MKKLVIILCIFLLTGCGDYVEINDLAIITGMSLDYKDKMYDVTIQMVDSKSPEETNKVITFNAQSESIEKAVDKLSDELNKKIFISHLKSLLISKNILKQDANFYDSFLRNPKSRLNFNIFVVDDEITGKDILEYQSSGENSAMYLESLLTFNKDTYSSASELVFHIFLTDTYEKGKNVIYPVVSFKDIEKKDKIIIKNLVTYNYKNDELKLDEIESILYNMLVNKAGGSLIDINCEDEIFALEMNSSKTKYKWEKNIFKIDISIDTYLSSYHCKWDLSDKETEKKLRNLTEKQILEKINLLIKKAQENENDFIGLGNHIYKYDYDYFDFNKDIWDKKFKNLNIKTNVDISINNTGELRKKSESEK